MRRVHFIDTSILLCLLKVPNTCDDKYSEVIEELKNILSAVKLLFFQLPALLKPVIISPRSMMVTLGGQLPSNLPNI